MAICLDGGGMKFEVFQRPLTAEQVADYLQVRPSTIYQWTHTGYIPHVKLGNRVRFRLSQADGWIEKKSKSEKSMKVADLD
jgi:excisionase family DNA binding protein